METITLEEARRVISAAETQATEIGQPMDIAVVDAGGNLKSHSSRRRTSRRSSSSPAASRSSATARSAGRSE